MDMSSTLVVFGLSRRLQNAGKRYVFEVGEPRQFLFVFAIEQTD